ncbi:MAG: hypothetical protein K6B74_02730 [Ruminococcus sp.]|nr:hypothetical protein [Ruminococcus sp.]
MKTVGMKKKKLPVVLASILAVVGGIAGFVAFNASKNMTAMNKTVDSGMDILSKYAKVTPVDPGEYKQIKMKGVMNFDVSQYDVENIGDLSVMTVNMGFMQMASYVITPYEKNMPLLSMDFMYIMGKRKAYAEFYDLVEDPASGEFTKVLSAVREFESKYSDMEDIETAPAWYDKYLTVAMHKAAKNTDDAKVEQMFCDAIQCYMETAEGLDTLDAEAKAGKLELTQEYSDGLIANGGVSTDVFKSELGEEKTKDFFDNVFFGTNRYRNI